MKGSTNSAVQQDYTVECSIIISAAGCDMTGMILIILTTTIIRALMRNVTAVRARFCAYMGVVSVANGWGVSVARLFLFPQ